MTVEEIEKGMAELSDIPCGYSGKTVVITAYRINEKHSKVYIYFKNGGLPEEWPLDSMRQFFKYCCPLAMGGKKAVEKIKRENPDMFVEEDEEETADESISEEDDSPNGEELFNDEGVDVINNTKEKRKPRKKQEDSEEENIVDGNIDALTKSRSPEAPVQPALVNDGITVTFNDLKEILMESIEKVRNDPKYISQANAIKGNIDTLLNAAKVQLQIIQHRDKQRLR